jgi:RNA polymerase sigma-70 factor (ECF subfamily)
MILWRKWDQYAPAPDPAPGSETTDFVKWACGIAHFEVMNYLRKAERRTVALDRDVMDLIAAEQLQLHDELSDRRAALEHCLDQLPPRHRQLLEAAYAGAEPIKDIARRLGQTANAAYVALRRIRHAVADCITRRVAGGAE